ncbi:MAG: hypothetical protein AMXMBFR56_65580 [Polyangiaceae bacterium]
MAEPNSNEPLGDAVQYTDFSSDVSLEYVSPACRCARFLRVEDVGGGTTLKLVFDDNPTVTRTFVVAAGREFNKAKIRKIITGTTVSRVTVGF